jgi:hypothetical protein
MKEEFGDERHAEFKQKSSRKVIDDIRENVKKEMVLEQHMLKKELIKAAEKDLEAKTQRLRDLVDSKLRPEFRRRFEQEKREELHQEIEAELQPILLAKIRNEETELLKKQVEAELRPILLTKVRGEEKEELKAEVEAALRPVIEQEIRGIIEAQNVPRRNVRYQNGKRSTRRATKKKGKKVLSDEVVPRKESVVPEEEAETEREVLGNVPREKSVPPVPENDPDTPEEDAPEEDTLVPEEENAREVLGVLREGSVEQQDTSHEESPEIDPADMEDSALKEQECLARQRERALFLDTLDRTGEEEIEDEDDVGDLDDYIDGDDGGDIDDYDDGGGDAYDDD